MECYSALKKKNSQNATWKKPEDIVLSEINQSQKDKCCIILCT